jgi:hypothetical protein
MYAPPDSSLVTCESVRPAGIVAAVQRIVDRCGWLPSDGYLCQLPLCRHAFTTPLLSLQWLKKRVGPSHGSAFFSCHLIVYNRY